MQQRNSHSSHYSGVHVLSPRRAFRYEIPARVADPDFETSSNSLKRKRGEMAMEELIKG